MKDCMVFSVEEALKAMDRNSGAQRRKKENRPKGILTLH